MVGKTFEDKFATIVYSSEQTSAVDLEAARKVVSQFTPEELEDFLSADPARLRAINRSLPRLRVDLLQGLIRDLSSLLESNESQVQAWIDEDPKTRCLIFGLEYVDYKRETQFGNSRFDVLTDISGTEHVIIELKSPNSTVFDVKERSTKNGVKKDYSLSKDLAEAIPQVIKYFRDYNNESTETFIKNGTEEKKVPKATVIIGRNLREDPIWQEHYCDLRNRIAGVEILTYDHLIEKLQNQIRNLEELDNHFHKGGLKPEMIENGEDVWSISEEGISPEDIPF